jgi:hypothetical protein
LTQRDLQVEVPADDGPFEVFSQAVIVQPKGQAVATFDYLLPERVGAAGRYRLTWIRQVGTRRDRLRLEVFGRRAEVDPGGRSLKFQRDLTGSGPVQWLRRRWIVHQLGL